MNIFNELEKKFQKQNELKELFDFKTYQQYQDIKNQELISIKNALKIANKLGYSLDYIYKEFLTTEKTDFNNLFIKLSPSEKTTILTIINGFLNNK
ncbi:MAG: hypothetical protein E7369_02780 [Clostridiales bacterium]|nr:hypothetical protein [Clostridiales bacterium]